MQIFQLGEFVGTVDAGGVPGKVRSQAAMTISCEDLLI